MADQESTKASYDLRGSKFGGGFAAEGGIQIGGTFNDFSVNQNMDEITSLIESLRDLIQNFPEAQREEGLVTLEDLTEDIQKPERQPKKIKTRLMRLLAIAATVATVVPNVVDFTNNVLELSDKLGFSIEQIQPQSAQQPSPLDIKVIEP